MPQMYEAYESMERILLQNFILPTYTIRQPIRISHVLIM
jgi:hypothetical protein